MLSVSIPDSYLTCGAVSGRASQLGYALDEL